MLTFRDITFDDINILNKFKYIASDYTFSYLYMYCEQYKLKIAEDKDVVIIMSGEITPSFYMPLGNLYRGIDTVLDFCKTNNTKPIFTKIPYNYLKYFDQTIFKIKEDRNSFDYIFNTPELADYEGKEYRKQRNNLSSYLNMCCPEFKNDFKDDIDKCRDFTIKHYSRTDILNPTLRILGKAVELKLNGGIVFNQGAIKGFCIYENISDDTALSHVELTDNSHRGIHTYMINMMSKTIEKKYINKEDDMGLLGLRRFKESYNPCFMLKKYSAFME